MYYYARFYVVHGIVESFIYIYKNYGIQEIPKNQEDDQTSEDSVI